MLKQENQRLKKDNLNKHEDTRILRITNELLK